MLHKLVEVLHKLVEVLHKLVEVLHKAVLHKLLLFKQIFNALAVFSFIVVVEYLQGSKGIFGAD
jgi:hypothetical protein